MYFFQAFSNKSCDNIKSVTCRCKSEPENKITGLLQTSYIINDTQIEDFALCPERKLQFCNRTCEVACTEDIEIHSTCLYATPNFWFFIVLLCMGTICFNVANSLSDAICCDIIGMYFIR